MGPPDSDGVSRVPSYLGARREAGPVTRKGLSPAAARLSRRLRLRPGLPSAWARNPGGQAPRFGLVRVRSPLLTESLLFSLPPGTEMFHFPGFASRGYFIHRGIPPCWGRRIAPFGDPRVKRSPAPDRGLSQLATSFIASCRQGIRHPPKQPGRQKGKEQAAGGRSKTAPQGSPRRDG